MNVDGLPPEELLVYLCVHGAVSAWSQLKWLSDIPALFSSQPELDMNRALAQAREWGVSRLLAQGLLLAHEMMGVPLPSSLTTLAYHDPVILTLIDQARQALLTEESTWQAKGSWRLCYELRFRPELLYKWHTLYRFCQCTEDYAVIRLPDRLFPLYFLLRPFIWGIRQLRKYQESLRA